MMKKIAIATALIATLGSVYSQAEEPSFNYIEGGYSKIENSDGAIVRGNYEIGENVYITGSYSDLTDDDFNVDIDTEILTFGIGAKTAISDNTAIYGQAEYLDVESSSIFNTISDDGYRLAVGIRSMVTDSTELYSQLTHTDVNSSTTDLAVGVRQYFTDNIGVFAEYGRNDFDTETVNAGVSIKF